MTQSQLTVSMLSTVFEQAHQAVRNAQQVSTRTAHMASTLVILEILNGQAIWGHVGDSRLYLFRQDEVLHQTKDHSVPQMLVGSGELEAAEIRGHPDRNRLLRALGDKRDSIKARMVKHPITLENNDTFLLCTDGFWEWITEDEMLNALKSSADVKEWLKLLEALIEQRADKDCDNYSALAVGYIDNRPKKAILWKQWLRFKGMFLKK